MRINWHKILPEGYNAMKGLENFVEQSKLEPKLKELIKIRASQINGCAFCLDELRFINEENLINEGQINMVKHLT